MNAGENGGDPNEAPVAELHAAGAGATLADVRHVALLANLQLTPEEETRMQRDLNAVLGYVAMLAEIDTAGVPPLAQISELFESAPALAGATLRADEPRLSVDRTAVMHEAPETDGRFFKVPRVIER